MKLPEEIDNGTGIVPVNHHVAALCNGAWGAACCAWHHLFYIIHYMSKILSCVT